MRSAAYWFIVTLIGLVILWLLLRFLSGYIILRALGPLVPLAFIILPIIAGFIGLVVAKRPR